MKRLVHSTVRLDVGPSPGVYRPSVSRPW